MGRSYRVSIPDVNGYSKKACDIYKSIGTINKDELQYTEILVNKLGKIDKKLLDSMPILEIIAQPTTGLDHIDLKECKKRGIKVISLKGETEFLRTIPATAEHTIALMLSLMRKIPWAFDDTLAGHWDREAWRGRELKGKTLLVVGNGRIGQMVTKYGQSFGMNVLTIDEPSKKKLLKLLPKADVVSVHIPLKNNSGYFERQCFEAIKKGSYLINTSRGDIISEWALLEALKKGRIAGAALDVVQGEPNINEDLIDYALDNTNLLITPHIAGATLESIKKTESFIAKKVKEYIKTL